jgi:hypothetical protein
MKRLAIAISVAALALPLLAATEDSPLVRAAKATGRLSKKSKVVITNDTLVATGGHLATTDVTTPFTSGPESYSNLPAVGARSAAAAPGLPARPTPPPAQPTTVTTTSPGYTQTTAVGTISTAPVSYSGTTQPTVTTKTTEPPIATVKPPQPE